jgi:hypothetical protein
MHSSGSPLSGFAKQTSKPTFVVPWRRTSSVSTIRASKLRPSGSERTNEIVSAQMNNDALKITEERKPRDSVPAQGIKALAVILRGAVYPLSGVVRLAGYHPTRHLRQFGLARLILTRIA